MSEAIQNSTSFQDFCLFYTISSLVFLPFLLGYFITKPKHESKVQRQGAEPTVDTGVEVDDDDDVNHNLSLDNIADNNLRRESNISSQLVDAVENSKSILISIVELKKCGTCDYKTRPWALVRSESCCRIWVSRSKSDGILIRGTSSSSASVSAISKWLIDQDFLTCIEGVFQCSEVEKELSSVKGRIKIRKMVPHLESLASSNMHLNVATSISSYSQDGCIIATRSISENVLEKGSIPTRVLSSGFLLLPSEKGNPGCEISFGVHCDLLSINNMAITDKVVGTIFNVMNRINDECAYVSQIVETIPSRLDPLSVRNDGKSSDTNIKESFGNANIEVAVDQTAKLVSLAQTSLLKLRELYELSVQEERDQYSNINDHEIESLSENRLKWDVLHTHESNITVKELNTVGATMGLFSVTCTSDKSPRVMRKMLLQHPNMMDGCLEGGSILSRLNPNTYVQWLAYGSVWPLVGSRDFLLVTTEEPFDKKRNEGFVVVSTSIDDNIGNIENHSSSGDNGRYTRSYLRLAGYVGVLNKSGGTDLTLIVDVGDLFLGAPRWLLHIFIEHGLFEMMYSIKCGSKSIPKRPDSSKLEKLLSQIHKRELKISRYFKEDSQKSEHRVSGKGENDTPERLRVNSTTGHVHENSTGHNGQTQKQHIDTKSVSSVDAKIVSSDTNTEISRKRSTAIPKRDEEEKQAGKTSEEIKIESAKSDSHTVKPKLALHDTPFAKDGSVLAQEALRIMRVYLGLEKVKKGQVDPKLQWTEKSRDKKKNVVVLSSAVNESTWNAVRGVAVIQADKYNLLKLLTNDARIGEYDDMFDKAVFITSVDDRTSVRRMMFKAVWPTAPRDFIACTTWMEMDDGSIMIATRSAPDELCPEQKPFVRGFIQLSGYLIQPHTALPKGSGIPPGSCKITLTAHTELGGTLPVSVINMLSTNAPLKLLASVGDLAKK